FEDQATYTFNVIATDAKGLAATQAVTVTVTDVEEGDEIVLDDEDSDNNVDTLEEFDAADGDFTFVDSLDAPSGSTIANFEEGDMIRFIGDIDASELGFASRDGSPEDLEI